MRFFRGNRESNGEQLERFRVGSIRLRRAAKAAPDARQREVYTAGANRLAEAAKQVEGRFRRVRRGTEATAATMLRPASMVGVKTKPIVKGFGQLAEKVYREMPAPRQEGGEM